MNVYFPLNDVGGGRIVQSSAAEGGRGNAPPGTINSPGLQFTLTNILFYISAPPSSHPPKIENFEYCICVSLNIKTTQFQVIVYNKTATFL